MLDSLSSLPTRLAAEFFLVVREKGFEVFGNRFRLLSQVFMEGFQKRWVGERVFVRLQISGPRPCLEGIVCRLRPSRARRGKELGLQTLERKRGKERTASCTSPPLSPPSLPEQLVSRGNWRGRGELGISLPLGFIWIVRMSCPSGTPAPPNICQGSGQAEKGEKCRVIIITYFDVRMFEYVHVMRD